MKVVNRETCRPYVDSPGYADKGDSNFTMDEGMICAGGVVNEGTCMVITCHLLPSVANCCILVLIIKYSRETQEAPWPTRPETNMFWLDWPVLATDVDSKGITACLPGSLTSWVGFTNTSNIKQNTVKVVETHIGSSGLNREFKLPKTTQNLMHPQDTPIQISPDITYLQIRRPGGAADSLFFRKKKRSQQKCYKWFEKI